MQTRLADEFQDSPDGREAEAILRKCVHCGFCLATCPTYLATGNELDSPRGRIYLIKQLLEGQPSGRLTQHHLDRCLGCRACETTCPSGVNYHRLADIGRHWLERNTERPRGERFKRALLLGLLRRRGLFNALTRLGRVARPFVPAATGAIPRRGDTRRPAPRHAERWLLLEGCVQPGLAPGINAATARVLDALEISTEPVRGCCGALAWHLNEAEAGRHDMRRLVDACVAGLDRGAAGLLFTASGCGASVVDYGHLLGDDPDYAAPAARVAGNAFDLAQLLSRHAERLARLLRPLDDPRLAFHPPCSLQHGLRLRGTVEKLLIQLGYILLPVNDAHLCCGSAGSYSVLQPAMAQKLRADKLYQLEAGQPPVIATANIGCQSYLQAATVTPVRHWIELVAMRLQA